MAKVAFKTTELIDLADQLDRWAELGDQAVIRAIRETADDVYDEQFRRVPVDSGDTRDSITVLYADQGRTASIGPTNRDDSGKPVGFFIEYGARGIEPVPFVRQSAKHARTALARRLDDELARVFSS